ncbi:amino acid ABC transporter ATP-binding protein [Nocardioides agariphilus]|uniref:ABC-type polar-amino-acid transporter n=1 Tax=Nocardioides agariphilus TaxID=433664 RepID=A0A930VME3_9ACTN|nr:amino acid ABC transporter ATP-binding protein [Nocardioides agariphilus]MBF4769337.1 amino acid ABC transporter ATP-binding protein [Nocardioides agariphilus]
MSSGRAAPPGSTAWPDAPYPDEDPLTVLTGVHKWYGDLHVLRGVDLQVRRGEVVAIIGPSGSGKSTLLRCVNMLEQPSSGAVLFKGRDVTDVRVDLDRLRSRMGIVFQNYNLFPHLSVLENITLALRHVRGLGKTAAVDRALSELERVGLAEKSGAHPGRLSGGQQQRVAIARALAMRPDMLLCDEITSALDPELVGEVLQVLRDLAESHMTMIVVTHEMGFAREVASRLVFMDGGVIVEQGVPRDLLSNPQTERLQRFLSLVV